MIEQGFNYTDSTIKDMTDFFETRVENLELKEEKKTDSSVLESSKDFSMEHRKIFIYCILHGECSHSVDKCGDLGVMVKKQNQNKNMKITRS